MNVHKNARTTPNSRALLVHRVVHQHWPVSAVAMAFGISERTVLQQKPQRPVEFEISPATRDAVETCLRSRAGYVARRTLGTRQYALILDR